MPDQATAQAAPFRDHPADDRVPPDDDPDTLPRILDRQRRAAAASGAPSAAHRRAALGRLDALLRRHGPAFHAAIAADFGNRAWPETALAELRPVLDAISFSRGRLHRWMRPRRRRVGLAFQPGRAWTVPQPLGCVGIVSPWNYPMFLSLGPLVDALAAGNRVMLKPSEYTPRFTALLRRTLGEAFDQDEVAVVAGGPEVGKRFCALPFDHLMFTGSTATGRAVAHAAADALTPLTLELGGKSPAIVCADRATPATLQRTAHALAVGKFFNAGQTCIAPDYVLVPEPVLRPFAEAMIEAAARLYPRIAGNEDYTSLISSRHLARLLDALAEAEASGATVLQSSAHRTERDRALAERRLPPTVVVSPDPDGTLMRDEIFGPVLPLVPYRTEDEAIAFVNARPRPLALYCFTANRQREAEILRRTVSGGATINNTLLHAGQPDLPFGGVGASGHGSWHGEAGFLRFSHVRTIYRSGPVSGFTTMVPPHGRMMRRLLPLMLRR